MTPELEDLFLKYYNLTQKQKDTIKEMKNKFGMTIDEIARKFQITPPDVRRVLNPPKNYGRYTPEEKLKHWLAGQKMVKTKYENNKRSK